MDYRGTPMRLTLQDSTDDGIYKVYGCHKGTGAHEDVLVMASHTTSHMDALVHVYGDYKHYNGVGHDTMHALGGAQKLGIDKVGGFAGACGAARHGQVLRRGRDGSRSAATSPPTTCRARRRTQGVDVRAGDVVLVRTGYLQFWWDNAAKGGPPPFEQAGIGARRRPLAGRRRTSSRSAATTRRSRSIPFDDNDFLTMHKVLLVDCGIYMLEFLNLVEPASDGVYEGVITVGPLKVTGATGSPINPIFIG